MLERFGQSSKENKALSDNRCGTIPDPENKCNQVNYDYVEEVAHFPRVSCSSATTDWTPRWNDLGKAAKRQLRCQTIAGTLAGALECLLFPLFLFHVGHV